jgi:hypothetical protein
MLLLSSLLSNNSIKVLIPSPDSNLFNTLNAAFWTISRLSFVAKLIKYDEGIEGRRINLLTYSTSYGPVAIFFLIIVNVGIWLKDCNLFSSFSFSYSFYNSNSLLITSTNELAYISYCYFDPWMNLIGNPIKPAPGPSKSIFFSNY